MMNLSTDVLPVKNNRRVYRLIEEFTNWAIVEVGRNAVQNIQTTNAYGDMKPQNVATLITKEIQHLPDDAKLRYVPPLNQIWATSGKTALMFDLVTNGWYKQEFNFLRWT